MVTLTLAQVQIRSQRAQGRQIPYDQGATDPHGQQSGTWRQDCSGLICAIAALPQGVYCPSTSELTAQYVGAPIARSAVVPYRTVTMTTAADGTGHAFGHVALVVAFDRRQDQLEIQEHGGGIGPDIGWVPPGMAYDSVRKYGGYRPFKLYQLLNVASSGVPAAPPVAPGAPTAPARPIFPLPAGCYYGPYSGPANSISGAGLHDAPYRPGLQLAQGRLRVAQDGVYGPLTAAATRVWQSLAHIQVDGLIGPQTWGSLFG